MGYVPFTANGTGTVTLSPSTGSDVFARANQGGVAWADVSASGATLTVTTAVPTETITTIVGNGIAGYKGNGGAATAAELFDPEAVAVDSNGDLFIIDYVNNCIREVGASGTITTIAGNGTMGYSGDGGLAIDAQLSEPSGLAIDSSGDIFIADTGNHRIREVLYTPNYATSTIRTIAGDGTAGYQGDGGLATAAEFSRPTGVAVDASGNIFVADEWNNVIREVTYTTNYATSTIKTIAGNGTAGYSGDGGSATAAQLDDPCAIALDSSGDVFVSDLFNNRIREIPYTTNYAMSTIKTIAGDGTTGYSGDGGLATAAQLDLPWGIAVDSSGNIFFADIDNNRVREVNYTPNYATSAITTIAGNGTAGFGGDDGQASTAELHFPEGVALDTSGNLYIVDTVNNRIREVADADTNFAEGTSIDSSGSSIIATSRSSSVAEPLDVSNAVSLSSTATPLVSPAGDVRFSADAGIATSSVPIESATTGGPDRKAATVVSRLATVHDAVIRRYYTVSPAWLGIGQNALSPADQVRDKRLSVEALDAILAEYGQQ